MTSLTVKRCGWCSNDPLYMAYHDQEWGRPIYDEQQLFEMLCLEGQQAGLSWITVLKSVNVIVNISLIIPFPTLHI